MKTNDRLTPFWSTGLKWNIDDEKFYNLKWMQQLALRASFGYNGNVYNGSAYLTGRYGTSSMTGTPIVNILTAPNSELRWEKVKNINVGLDFESKNNIIKGSIDWFQKDGMDLIEPAPLAPSTGFTTFRGNAANTRTRGFDLVLNTFNVETKDFKWFSTILVTHLKDKVTHYDPKFNGLNLVSSLGGVAIEGKSLFGIYSYKWGGLDPVTGDPLGYLNKIISTNYAAIINNASPDSLIYHGSARPAFFGSFRNDFAYKGLSLSINIAYKLGYYFRRGSTGLSFEDVLLYPHSDFSKRWKNSGDENLTTVPSFTLYADANRSNFYQFSEILVEKGDHIRLQDVRLSYDINREFWNKMPFKSFQVYAYVTNLGILWRANDHKIDPDYFDSFSIPGRTISCGIKASF